MKLEEEEACKSVLTSVEARRTDVLKAVLDTIKKEWSEKELVHFINKSRDFGTFLHLATKSNQADMVRLLLTYGADPTATDKNGAMPIALSDDKHTKSAYSDALFTSIAQQEINKMELLLNSVEDVDVRDNPQKMNSLLHWAVSFKNKEALQLLIEHGTPLESVNSKGLTPLHEAVQQGSLDIVQLLVTLGANVQFPIQGESDLKGKTAVDLANPESELGAWLLGESSTTQFLNHDSTRSDVLSRDTSFSEPKTDPAKNTFNMNDVNASLSSVRMPVRPVITDTRLHWLWPPPKSIQQLDAEPFILHSNWKISFVSCTVPLHEILDVWDTHKQTLGTLGIDPVIGNVQQAGPVSTDGDECFLTCCVKTELFPASESYRLTITTKKISLIASDCQGLHYALATLEQLVTLCQNYGHLPPIHIDDSPSVRIRAVFLDVSSGGRIPHIDALFSLIDIWHSLKLNQLHLYTRISHSYGVHWPWPYSKVEVLSLDRYCRDRRMQLVPALDVTGEVETNHLRALISTSQSCFASSRFFHAGPGLTSLLVEAFDQLTLASDMTWFLCANSIRDKKVSPGNFPGSVLVEYGFQADYNFHQNSKAASEESASLCFCAGTASWNCIASFPEAAAANILYAVQGSVERGSLGTIVATWTDSVALGSLYYAIPGWVLQAGLAWNHTVHWDFIQNSLSDLISIWFLKESPEKMSSIGTAIVEMGRIETWLWRYARGEITQQNSFESGGVSPFLPPSEGSVHYRLLLDPDSVNIDSIDMDCIVRTTRHSKRCHKMLSEVVTPENGSVFFKIVTSQALLTADFLVLACRLLRGILTVGSNPNSNMGVPAINLGIANLSPTLRTDAANKLLSLTERFKELWRAQYQTPSNGLNSAVSALNLSIQRLLANVE